MNDRKAAYICHLILAAALCVVLAMHVHLVMIDAGGEVIGAGMFLLVMWLGLPILALLGAVAYFSYKGRSDRKIVLLTAILIVMILQWFVSIEPAMIISITIESLYVILSFSIGLWSVFRFKNAQATQ